MRKKKVLSDQMVVLLVMVVMVVAVAVGVVSV